MEQPDITGYRELSETDAQWMNEAKELAVEVGAFVSRMKAEGEVFDQRWVAIGATDCQRGFMALVRAVAKPTTF
jgi:hypothetical protein